MFWNRASIFEESSFHLDLFFKLWFAREDIAVTAGRVLAESRVNVSTRSIFLGLLFKWETMMNSLPLFQLKSGKWDSWFIHMNSVEIRSTMMIDDCAMGASKVSGIWWLGVLGGNLFPNKQQTITSITFYYTYIIRYWFSLLHLFHNFNDRPTVFLVMNEVSTFVQSHTEVWKRPRCGSRQVWNNWSRSFFFGIIRMITSR